MQPIGLSQNALARALHAPPCRINELVQGERAVSADTDLRLARYFRLSEGFFLGLQADFDLMQRKREIAAELATISPRAAGPASSRAPMAGQDVRFDTLRALPGSGAAARRSLDEMRAGCGSRG